MVNGMRFKTIIKNINLLNIVLMATIAVFANYFLFPLLDLHVKYTLPSPKETIEEKEEKTVEAQPPQPLEYTIIAEQNIFHPERKIPVEKKDEKSLPKPEFVLYGTIITGDTRLAFIDDTKSPQTSPGGGKRQSALHLGSSLSGFTLSEVYEDKVVMARGEERIEVMVLDSAKSRAVEAGKKPAAVSTPKQPSSRSTRPVTGRERSEKSDLRPQTRSRKQTQQN